MIHQTYVFKWYCLISLKTKNTDNQEINSVLVGFNTHLVGVAGFEPAASCSQSRRDNRATLHPELFL